MVIWTFARLTVREASRSRLLLITAALTVLYLGLVGWGAHYIRTFSRTLTEAQVSTAAIEVVAFYGGSFMFSLLAVFVAGASVYHDGQSGLLQAVLARPVRRFDLIAGRWLGSAGVLVVYTALFTLGIEAALGVEVGYSPPHPALAASLIRRW